MVDGSPKVYLKNNMCPFRKDTESPNHPCNISGGNSYGNPKIRHYGCSFGEWSEDGIPPCDPHHRSYNDRIHPQPPYKDLTPIYDRDTKQWIIYNERTKQWVVSKFKPRTDNMVNQIMGLLPPIDYLGDKLYDLRKIDRLDEYDYGLPNDEARKKYFEEHREEAEKLLRRKKCSCKPKRKPIKKTIKKCSCKKK